jgi:hypothetical protein
MNALPSQSLERFGDERLRATGSDRDRSNPRAERDRVENEVHVTAPCARWLSRH